jgi:hypothetical protein
MMRKKNKNKNFFAFGFRHTVNKVIFFLRLVLVSHKNFTKIFASHFGLTQNNFANGQKKAQVIFLTDFTKKNFVSHFGLTQNFWGKSHQLK